MATMTVNKWVLVCFLIHIQTLRTCSADRPPTPQVPWADSADFVLDEALSDEFSGKELDTTKWDAHGVRNPDTGCPKWNGPVLSEKPQYSTFYPTTTNPASGKPSVRQYRLKKGQLHLKISRRPKSFFKAREYYCNATTFSCNHDASIPCHSTNFWGEPEYADAARTRYLRVVHDVCKREPFCLPHHIHVTNRGKLPYSKLTAPHIVSKRMFKYGFVEARVKLTDTPAVLAVWMHNDDMVDGFCRFRKVDGPRKAGLECPSVVRSRRWQEIDILEAMNSDIHGRLYIPNIHSFAMYKGEFSAAHAKDNGNGDIGGGPIIVRDVFRERNPSFSDVDESEKVANDWHLNAGSVYELDAPWAKRMRTVGMYWSAQEIRFYVDGNEVMRLKNSIIHQPMYIDLAYGLNVGWAKQAPTKKELKRTGRIDYIRTWKVFTKDGVDPPSNNILNLRMEETFDARYGNEMYGVLGRFPVNDGYTIVPEGPTSADGVVDKKQRSENSSQRFDEWGGVGPTSVDYIDSELLHITRKVQKRHPTYKPAGGEGNSRFSKRPGALSAWQRRILLSRDDRKCLVSRKGGKVSAQPLADGAQTIFEFTNPQKLMAGWATRNASGIDENLA